MPGTMVGWEKVQALVPEDVLMMWMGSQEWLINNVPPIKFIFENPVMAPIRSVFEASANFKDTLYEIGVQYIKAVVEINGCFNSEKYSDLSAKGRELLDRDVLSPEEKDIYSKGVLSHNRLMDFSEKLTGINAEIQSNQLVSKVAEVYGGWQQKNEADLRERARVLTAALENLSGHARRRPRQELTDIERTLEHYASNPAASAPQGAMQLSPTVAITPVIPTVAGAAGVLVKMGEFILTHFLMRGMSFPMQLLGALSNTIGAIALKILGSSGAQALYYVAAGVMRTFRMHLPRIFTFGGIFSGAMSFLAAYAPYICIAALIVVLLVKNHQKRTFGQNIYVFGSGSRPGFSVGRASKSDEDVVRAVMLSLGQSMVEMSGGASFTSILGFACNELNEPTFGMDLTGRNVTEIEGDTELEAAFAPWRSHVEKDLEEFWWS